MKKAILLTAYALLGSLMFNAQVLYKECDEFTGDCYYFADRNIVVHNASKTQGFSIRFMFDQNTEKAVISGMYSKMVGIGNCVENNTIYFIFEDGSKANFVSFNKFNCEGDAFFHISPDDLDLFRTKKISKVKISNGYSYESFSADLDNADKGFLREIVKLADSNTLIKAE